MSAVPKPDISNPGTIFATNNISNALITNVKSPSVRTLIGSVNARSIGRMNTFTTANTIAASIAPVMPILAPGTRNVVTTKTTAVTMI